jgi:hypothetical protein
MRSTCTAALLAASLLIATGAQAAGPCDDFVRKLPNLRRSLCDAAQLQATAARSVKGQTLWMRDVKPEDVRQRVLVLGRLYLDQVGIFPGSLGNYGGVHKGVPVVTIELPNAMRTPLDAEMRQMWLDLLRWMTERVPAGDAEASSRTP